MLSPMFVNTIYSRLQANLDRTIERLPRRLRWLDNEAPGVAAEYRGIMRAMYLFWLPAALVLIFALAICKEMHLNPETFMVRFGAGLMLVALVVFAPPGYGYWCISKSAFHAYKMARPQPSWRLRVFIVWSVLGAFAFGAMSASALGFGAYCMMYR